MSLSFVVPTDQWGKNKIVGCLESAKSDEIVFAKIDKEQAARGSKIKEYKFDIQQVEAFRYRMEDALRSVTRSAIKEARIKELKTEILNSEKLKVRAPLFASTYCSLRAGALRGQSSGSRIFATRQTITPHENPSTHEARTKVSLTSHHPSRRHRGR
jgi:hypothetical protein